MLFHVASTDRASAFRSNVLSLAKTCSIGLRWAVGRQEQEPGADAAYGLAHGLPFVAAEIVHDDDVAGRERWHQELLDIGGEELAVDRPIDHAGCVDPVASQGGEEGERAPLAEWRLGMEPLTPPGAAMRAGHVGLGPGLVDEDEARRIKPTLIFAPLCPPPGDLRTILLAGEQAFFLNDSPSRSRNSHRAP